MGRSATERSYLSIREVLDLLVDEFPDVTISKIRFLESRGLIHPERTPSGYRKFYESDVERLRWILRQQREHFLPLKVIKGRLEGDPVESSATPSLFDQEPLCADESLVRELVPAASMAANGSGVPSLRSGRPGAPAGESTPTPHGAPPARRASRASVERSPMAPSGEAGPTPLASMGASTGKERSPAEPPSNGEGSSSEEMRTSERGDASGYRDGETRPFIPPSRRSSADRAETAGEASAAEPVAVAEVTDPPATVPSATVAPGAVAKAKIPEPVVPPAAAAPAGMPEPSGAQAAAPQPAAAPAGPLEPSGGPARQTAAETASPARPTVSVVSGAHLSVEEVATAVGVEPAVVLELEEFGLLAGRDVAGVHCYDEEALVIARLAAGFRAFGLESRHLRTFKHAAEREAGLFAQVVTPLLRQRNPAARERAHRELGELAALGAALQEALVRAELRELTGG